MKQEIKSYERKDNVKPSRVVGNETSVLYVIQNQIRRNAYSKKLHFFAAASELPHLIGLCLLPRHQWEALSDSGVRGA